MNIDWKEADSAFKDGQSAYIRWCIALGKVRATQQQIADRYECDQSSISRAVLIGKDPRVIRSTNNIEQLPKSQHTLYLLTTLDDKGFEELCKPSVTEANVLNYKRKIQEGQKSSEPKPATKQEPKPEPKKQWRSDPGEIGILKAKNIIGLDPLTLETLEIICRALKHKHHPDKGGNPDQFKLVCKAADRCLEDFKRYNGNI